MIKNTQALNLSEVKDTLNEFPQLEENEISKVTEDYISKFVKIKSEKAEELKQALRSLGIEKLKDKHIAKIIDLMPEDSDDLKKIFVGEDFSLDSEEITSILGKIKAK